MADERAFAQRLNGTALAGSSHNRYLRELQRLDLAVVQQCAAFGRIAAIRPFVLFLNHLGNGWLYPLLVLLLWWAAPSEFVLLSLSSVCAAVIAHAVYPLIKRKVARLRPFEVDSSLKPLLPVLDRFAFPSGHCMTVTAVMIPITVMHTALLPLTLSICLLIALARLMAAHHYPTDLVAGFVLGALASLPVVAVIS